MKYREEPIDIWAFIRVYNEMVTVRACLESIKPVIKHGVIAYHKLRDRDVDDGTIAYIHQFVKENPGFIIYEYPYQIYPPCHNAYRNIDKIPKEQRIDSYYQAVFDQIPDGAWFMKIDADHVYETEKLEALRYLPKDDKEFISLGYMNVHYLDGNLYILKEDSNGMAMCLNSGDHWLVKKREHLSFFLTMTEDENDGLFACEVFNWKYLEDVKVVTTEVFNWHFKFMKAWRNSGSLGQNSLSVFSDKQKLVWESFDKDKILNRCKEFSFSEKILDKDYLLNICKKYFD